jgi:hypothetical protein
MAFCSLKAESKHSIPKLGLDNNFKENKQLL